MADAASSHAPQPQGATGVLVLADGTLLWGHGFGAVGAAVGEVCFNTAMTGYQEVMTDPSYAGQVVTFTFPHIGNVGVNDEDLEAKVEGAVGCVVREDVIAPSNFRAEGTFGDWLAAKGKIGLAGIDTRALTRRIRLSGAPNAVIAHDPLGTFDIPALLKRAQDWPGLEGMDLTLEAAAGPLRLSGLAALPAYSRAGRDEQYFFVNGRFVRDKLLTLPDDLLICPAHGEPFHGLHIRLKALRDD